MISFARRFSVAILGCLLLTVAGPLQAQLDPRLQSGKTDFLDLYQQSSSSQAKPEIITVFDYSRSMASLMYHPQYQNADIGDNDVNRYMAFTYHAATGGALGNNTFTIQAKTGGACGATSTMNVVVATTGIATGTASGNGVSCGATAANSPQACTITAKAVGNTAATATMAWNPINAASSSASNNTSYNAVTGASSGAKGTAPGTYTMSTVTVSPSSGPYAPNVTYTMTAYLTHPFIEGEDGTHKNITWSNSNGSAGTLTAGTTVQVSSGYYMCTATFKPAVYTYVAGTAGTPTQLTPIVMSPNPAAAGALITFKCYYQTLGTGNGTLTWTTGGSNNCSVTAAAVSPTTTTSVTTTAPGPGVTWHAPAYCGTLGGVNPAYVSVTLDPRNPTTTGDGTAANVISGITYLTAVLNAGSASNTPTTGLVKPDGSMVTSLDFPATYSSQSLPSPVNLYGYNNGIADVRNWIRMASHVRFLGSNSRTIDIPIPWMVSARANTFPLTPVTVFDRQVKTSKAADGSTITTNYGTGVNVEVDESYKVENSDGSTFTLDSNGGHCLTTVPAGNVCTLYTVIYRPAYISWLFTGKYQNTVATNLNYTTVAAYNNTYIVNDAGGTTPYFSYSQTALGNTATATTWGRGYGPAGTWGNTIVPAYNLDGTYKAPVTADASSYAIPALTRLQACKKAALATWVNHQADVFWAFRFLDNVNESGGGGTSTIDNNSTTTISGNNATTTYTNGSDSGWALLNNVSSDPTNLSTSGRSYLGMRRIASMFASDETPLTYAMARALAQYTDPNSIFNSVVGTNVSQCVNSYLILFTDGIDNNGQEGNNNANVTTPYVTGTGATATFNALTGNRSLIASPTSIDRSGTWWNFYTFAGIGAHLADSSLGVVNNDYLQALNPGSLYRSGVPSSFLPLAIYERNYTVYSKPHRVTTMTVGVSLGGQYTDPNSPKRSLFLAAVAGDPATNSGALNSFHSFVGSDDGLNDWVKDPHDPTSFPTFGMKATGAVYFFDATDAAKLSSSLDYALRIAISAGGNNATSNPNLPYVGSSLGKQVYVGKFQTPKTGGVIWPGDLLMFGTRQAPDGTFSIIDTSGNIAQTVDSTTAQWSTATALFANRLWKDRKLFTRLPGNSTNPELGLHTFSDTGTAYTNAAALDNTAGLKNYVAVPALTVGSAAQAAVIQNAMGGNTTGTLDGSNRPTTNRTNIMGDVIDSSPASLEYLWTDSTITTGIAAHSALSLNGANRFRLILVGTNQGWLHAFGEVSSAITVTDASQVSQEIITGKVDELWSFMPTDFLANLSYPYGASSLSNTHRFMVDGTPAIYFLDLPPTAGGQGNGVVDYGSDPTTAERAIAIIGLGKGGRSYYALDIHDPFNPTLKWSLVPDEAAVLPHSRNLTALSDAALRTIIANMGFSTCTPGVGRVTFTAGGVTKLRDVVFLGGGLSVPEIESNFAATPLGRSVIALDVYTGEILSAVALPLGSGPVVAGVVPFEYILNSGMAQRAYFLDRSGGLWAWGSMATPASTDTVLYPTYKDYRLDSSNLGNWTADGTNQSGSNLPALRKVYQDGSGNNAIYTTLPAPFRVGSFPGKGKNGAVAPSAAGVAIISGDRNNPLDWFYTDPTRPSNHRLTVVFDRQDSKAWGLDSTGITDSSPASPGTAGHIRDFSSNALNSGSNVNACLDSTLQNITPGCDNFYLAPKTGDPYFGYFINLPSITGSFIPKGINTPMVVAGSLFYTYFTPTSADPCTGGNGLSYSKMISDVIMPVVTDTRSGIAAPSGLKYTWSGVASNYSAFGTRGVFQGGTVGVTNPPPGGSSTTPLMINILGKSSERYPKARVWRTIQ